MSNNTFNLNQAVDFINYINNLNSGVNSIVGIDLLYFRAIPHKNGESLIFHEYTLLDVECHKEIKGVVKNTDYGNGIEIDLFGVKYDAPLQIQFDMTTWNNVFGPGTMPQKDDIVFAPVLNRLFEVNTSTPIYGFINQQTAWQIDMVKYSPKASRAENESLARSIEESTVSITELFGDHISQEIADITDVKEFSPYNSVSNEGDWFKEVSDKSAIIGDDLYINSFLISNGYYNASYKNFKVRYKNSSDTLLGRKKRSNRYLSCWFRPLIADTTIVDPIKDFNLHLRIKSGTQYSFVGGSKYAVGDEITITQGSTIRISGKIVAKNGNKTIVEFANKDILKLNKKITGWDKQGSFAIEASKPFAMTILSSENKAFDVRWKGSSLEVKVGNNLKIHESDVELKNQWYGLCLNIGKSSTGIIFDYNGNPVESIDLGDFTGKTEVDEYILENGEGCLSNIRLYEFEKSETNLERMKEDLFRTFSTNANNCIIADKAEIPNYMDYIGKIR